MKLHDQFAYRWGIDPVSGGTAFMITLGQALAISGGVLPDPEPFGIPDDAETFGPFEWPGSV